jgi:hypothetical protein
MPDFAARRVAILAVLAPTTVVTGSACGARPAAPVGDLMILAAPAPAQTAVPRQAPAPAPAPAPADNPVDPGGGRTCGLEAAARQVEPNTTLGAVVLDRVDGGAVLSVNPDRQFRSASLVKLLIAIDALHGGADEPDRERLARMLSTSDDEIASSFWVRLGPDLVRRVTKLAGLRGTGPPELSGQWADDFDQHFGIPDGLDAHWAVKQGWGNNDHAMVLHSTGLVGADWRYVVVLLTEHPLGSGWRTSADAVTAADGALADDLPGA